MSIVYLNTKKGDILRIVGAGAPGFAKIGDLVRVTDVQLNGVIVMDVHGNTAQFCFNCGAARLEPTEWHDNIPTRATEEVVK